MEEKKRRILFDIFDLGKLCSFSIICDWKLFVILWLWLLFLVYIENKNTDTDLL